jgi:hypothetical protein
MVGWLTITMKIYNDDYPIILADNQFAMQYLYPTITLKYPII